MTRHKSLHRTQLSHPFEQSCRRENIYITVNWNINTFPSMVLMFFFRSCLRILSALVQTSTCLAWSLTASSPSKTMCVVLLLVSLGDLVFWGWWNVYLYTPLCYFVAIMYLFSQSLSIVLWWEGSAAEFNFSNARCIRWRGSALIRVSRRCNIDVMLLGYVCWTRLIQTRITVCSVSFLPRLPEFDIPDLRPQLIHYYYYIRSLTS